MAFYLTEVEKAKFGARKEVLVTLLSGIDNNLVPRPTSSARGDEELAVRLKPLIRMTDKGTLVLKQLKIFLQVGHFLGNSQPINR